MKTIAQRVIQEVILPWKVLAILAIIALLLATFQSCSARVIRDRAVTARDVNCTVTTFNADGEMQLNCPAHGVKTLTDSSLALDYAIKRRPLTCTLRTGIEPDCEIAD